jgi:predicted nucleotidyltransferase component of viral defense system
VIAEKFLDLYARNSGLRDKLVAERDVVLTYALRALHEEGVFEQLAFKGGTCLRKTVFGSAGRFSEDLDFTLDSDEPEDDALVRVVEVFNREHYGITFTFDEYYKTDSDTSFGGEVLYRHGWNSAGRFRLQVSLRERPTLPVAVRPMKPQGYFAQLEFEPFEVRSIEVIEMVAEKVRAAFQRSRCGTSTIFIASRRRHSTARCCAASPSSSSGRCATRSIRMGFSSASAAATTTGMTCAA